MNLKQLQDKLSGFGIVMPLPWTDLRTGVFCCRSCIASELVKFAGDYEGAAYFCEQAEPGAFLWLNYGRLYVDENARTDELELEFAQHLFVLLKSFGLTVHWSGDVARGMRVVGIDLSDFAAWLDEKNGDYGDDEYLDEEEDDE